jgi:uncharacterized protein
MANSRLAIRVDGDGLSAFVAVTSGPALDRAMLEAELRAGGVVEGIDTNAYERIANALLDANFSCSEGLIAAGTEAHPGKDAWLELNFDEGIQPGHVRDDGTVDYHERDLLKPVRRGETLGRLHPREVGISGMRVDGTPIAAPPVRELSLELHSSVSLDESGNLRAERDGVVLYIAGKILEIVEHHVHKGAVDLHSGNLRMQGSLEIHGDVKHPFSAVATGDIDIRGHVDAATVRAGGAVHVRGGVRGGEGAAVFAEGDLTVLHAESAELGCGGQLRVKEAINSRLCAAQVYASGRLRGGQAVAESRIVAKEAGAPSGVVTRLTAGEPLTLPVERVQQLISTLKAERMAERAGGRSSDRAKGGKIGRVRAELDAEQVQRLAERARRREALLRDASIQIGLAHPGVSICFGAAHVAIDELARSLRYSYDGATASIRIEKAI